MKSINQPLVSILLPVYNGRKFLKQAIQSMLLQTYKNFEMIIIDDGSKDNSIDVVKLFDDSRIRFYRQANSGLAATLNRAIELANGKYLARQDQDDISLPTRLEKQVNFLEKNPDCGLVGTWASIMEDEVHTERTHEHPVFNESLKLDLLFNNPFVHSSVMLRKSVFDKIATYTTDSERQPPEDYELWSRIANYFEVANIPEILHLYREIPTSMSRGGIDPFRDNVFKISVENLTAAINSKYKSVHIQDIAALSLGHYKKLSKRPNLIMMLKIIHRISKNLDPSSSEASREFSERLNFRYRNLIFNYARNRNNPFLSYMIGVIRKIGKFIK